MMKERPILFSAPMVRAILDGRKTQTRRVVKPARGKHADLDALALHQYGKCPYGQPGDRLWVKEGWSEQHPLSVQHGRYSQQGRAGIPGPPGVTYNVIYRADGEPLQVWRRDDQAHPYFTTEGPADEIAAKYPTVSSNFHRGGGGIYWCNARFMPRWASRITLEVTGVRVERLQEMPHKDAWAEGVIAGSLSDYSAFMTFKELWESINGPGSWAANPWVWVVEFKVVK